MGNCSLRDSPGESQRSAGTVPEGRLGWRSQSRFTGGRPVALSTGFRGQRPRRGERPAGTGAEHGWAGRGCAPWSALDKKLGKNRRKVDEMYWDLRCRRVRVRSRDDRLC
jgi:hypothetical protein